MMRRPIIHRVFLPFLRSLFLLAFFTSTSTALTGRDVQDRLDSDIAQGNPVVVHVVVALCDNANQGIVPVPDHLGNGQDPISNLYWGAAYGVRTFLPRSADWMKVETTSPEGPCILDRIVLFAMLPREDSVVPVYLIADAWDGAHIQEAMNAFFEMSAGLEPETVSFNQDGERGTVEAGGSAHLLAYVGHNGLMEFGLDMPVPPPTGAPPRSAMVLACMSLSFFHGHLESAGAHSLLLTTGLMAPEAYTLDGAIRTWVTEGTTVAVIEAAAHAYNRYQHCGMRGARGLFWGEP